MPAGATERNPDKRPPAPDCPYDACREEEPMSELLNHVNARLNRPERVIEVPKEMVDQAPPEDQRRARRLCREHNIMLREVITPVAGRER